MDIINTGLSGKIYGLELFVLNRKPDRAFKTFARRVVVKDDFELVFVIIGESHYVEIREGDRLQFVELLACVPGLFGELSALGETKIVGYLGLTELPVGETSLLSCDPGYTYTCALTIQEHGQGFTLDSETNHIEHIFPQEFGSRPCTRIRWEIIADNLQWYTHHLYPHPGGVTEVVTKTVVNRRRIGHEGAWNVG